MIVIDRAASGSADPRLAGMFRARKQVFVDLLGWDLPVLQGQYEIDQFDGADATYVVLNSAEGEHLASARLLSTERPHLLGSLFPQLCAAAPPRGPGIVEITRFCLTRSRPARERRQLRNRLVSALVELALARGIRTYVGVAELGWLQQILAFGWQCAPLGLPVRIGGQLLGALSIEVDATTPALLAAAGTYVAAPAFDADRAAA
jgi:acyl-homoserine lactone synthase